MLLQKSPTSRNMAFNGTWKIDRNENYEKFMEAMGKSYSSNAFYKNNTTITEYKLKLSTNYLLASLSFHCLLLCPCIVYCICLQKITRGRGETMKCSDFNYVILILSNSTYCSRFTSAEEKISKSTFE